jgi:adenosine deaminase
MEKSTKKNIALNPELPVVDLHRHLEGAMRLTTVMDVCRKHGLDLPSWNLSDLQKAVWIDRPVSDIIQIFPRFDLLRQAFVDESVCRRVTIECLEDAVEEGLDYLELRFSPYFMAEPNNLSPMAVTAAVCEGWQESIQHLPITARLIVILTRTYGPELCSVEMDCALAYKYRGVAGIDLAGDEKRWPSHLFKQEFDRARDAGLFITAHAGEFAGADSIRETINVLHPQRLGHAVRAVDDPSLIDEIAKSGIAIECCPSSNFLTGSIPSLQDHPLPVFLKHGIKATINTDDPSFMGDLTIGQEYQKAMIVIGLTRSELDQIQRNGLDAAFIQPDEKQAIYSRKQKTSGG